ncbi:transposase, partial [Streptococcus danieliae]|nr:transposase [Streptococcus danieliae]
FEDSRKTYGTRRIKADLESQGITISRRKIGQIMQKYKLVSKYRECTISCVNAKKE